MKKLKVGVIGIGSMGANHARIYSELPNVELVGIADSDDKRAKDISSKYKCSMFSDYRQLLEKLDAVSISTPTLLHYEIALECISSGIHMLVEKPFTKTVEEARDLIGKANKNNVIIQVGFVDRYNPAVIKLKELTADQNIIAIEIRRLSPPIKRASDVSVVFDLMIHDIDHVLEFANSKVKAINAAGNYTYVVANILFENGIIANLTASKASYTKIREFNITTDEAYFSADMFKNEVNISRTELRSRKDKQYINFGDLTTKTEVCSGSEPLKAELISFVNCILENKKTSASGIEGLKSLEIAGEIEKLCCFQ